jgi:hypothetical protein
MKMAPILSLPQLRSKAQTDPNYRRLAILAASNLGGDPGESLDEAMKWLYINAQETDEEGVVEEVNFCRDLV